MGHRRVSSAVKGAIKGGVFAVVLTGGAVLPVGRPAPAVAQGFREATCPVDQKKTSNPGYRLANGRVLKTYCMGTQDERNKTTPRVAFIATQWSGEGKHPFWIHKCGISGGRNEILNQLDLSKRVIRVNRPRTTASGWNTTSTRRPRL